jgi:D-alanyl-D-alanine carboxypeptidase
MYRQPNNGPRGLLLGLLIAAGIAAIPSAASAEALLLAEVDSGKVLFAENAAYPWYPASVTKLMTLYVTLRAVKEGRITINTPFKVSANALSQSPTKMGFKVGTVVTVDNAIKMLMVKSANDMAVLLAEGVSGSVDAFADEMNANARRLGMIQSSFVNPNGLPADGQIVSARDLAILARALIREFPEYDDYWHLPGIRFGKRVIRNYNRLLDLYPGADGMKTGFICASGFNLVATATRDGRRLIAVVLGAPSGSVRAYKAAKLLEQGFNTGTGLNWLIPSLGTIDQLTPVATAPPNLRDQTCGPNRKRPAAEDEEVSLSEAAGDGSSPLAFMLQNLRAPSPKASQLLGQQVSLAPPVDVFIGATKPTTAAAAAAQEAQIEGPKGKKGKLAKKKGSTGTAEAEASQQATGTSGTEPAAATGVRPAPAKLRHAKSSATTAPDAAAPAAAAAPAKPKPKKITAAPASAEGSAPAKPAKPRPATTATKTSAGAASSPPTSNSSPPAPQ